MSFAGCPPEWPGLNFFMPEIVLTKARRKTRRAHPV